MEKIVNNLKETQKKLELFKKRWENYDGNNPNKFRSQINSLTKELNYYRILQKKEKL